MDLRKLTLRELKVMAGKRLGEKAAALKTKDELITALQAAEVKPAPKGDGKAASKPAAKAEAKSEAKPGARGLAKAVAKAVAKLEAKPAAKALAKAVAKAVAKLEAKAVAKSEAKPVSKVESKPAPRPKLTPVSAAEVKPAVVSKPVEWTPPKTEKTEVKPLVRPTPVPKKPRTVRLAADPPPAQEPGARSPAAARPSGPRASGPRVAGSRATVTQDFFVLPGTARLPSAHGDDRVLAFPRDTGGLYASWDFSEGTWGSGGAVLEVVAGGEEVLAELALDAACGGRFIEVSADRPVQVRVRRGGRVLGASSSLSLPAGKPGQAQRSRLTVQWAESLPTSAEPKKTRRLARLAQARALATSATGPLENEWLEGEWDVTSRTGVTSRTV